MSSSETKPISNLVKEIIFAYMKFYYDKYLQEHNIDKMSKQNINDFINEYCIDKETDLKKYIRNSLKLNQGDNYNEIITNNIINEIFSDIDYAKERLKLEILDYQNDM